MVRQFCAGDIRACDVVLQMNRRQLLFSATAAALAPALPVEAEASPFPPLYWRFTLSNGRRVTRCGFPFDEAARSALQWGDQITKVERMEGSSGWLEMTCFGVGTVTPEFIDMMVRNERGWQAYLSKRNSLK